MPGPSRGADAVPNASLQRAQKQERARAVARATAEQRRLTRHLHAVADRLWATPRLRPRGRSVSRQAGSDAAPGRYSVERVERLMPTNRTPAKPGP